MSRHWRYWNTQFSWPTRKSLVVSLNPGGFFFLIVVSSHSVRCVWSTVVASVLSQGTRFTDGLSWLTCDSSAREVNCWFFDVWHYLVDNIFKRSYTASDVTLLTHVPFTEEKLLESGDMTLCVILNRWEIGASYLKDQPSYCTCFHWPGDHGIKQRY